MKKNSFLPNSYAFSLMEILIVVIIVGVIASLALVKYGILTEKMNAKEIEQIAMTLLTSEKRYAMEHNGNIALNFNDLDFIRPTIRTFSYAVAFSSTPNSICMVSSVTRLPQAGEGNAGCVPMAVCPSGSGGCAGGVYTIYVRVTSPGGQMQVGCNDTGTGICTKMGY